ncbi:MAG: hypothetical protein NUV47_00630 [Patescibacteria group bacterium]|nr:hypothetical protein [Patescibacteria group bacterium]
MKKLIAVLIGLLIIPVTFAQAADQLPPTLPIDSPEMLIANAKRMVTSVSVWVNSQGFMHDESTVTSFNKPYTPSLEGQADFAEILNIASLAEFNFKTRNPKDWISLSVAFRGVVGNEYEKQEIDLFNGGTGFNLIEKNGTYSLPEPPFLVSVYPNGQLPLIIPGANDAEVAFLDHRGQTVQTEWLEQIAPGVFLFNRYWAGQKNVQVMATSYGNDGQSSRAVYNALTGEREEIRQAKLTASARMEEIVIIPTDQNTVMINMTDAQSARSLKNGVSPLVQVRFTEPKMLAFYAEVQDEVANGFWIRRADTNTWVYFSITQGALAEVSVPEAGVYDIVIDWPTFGKQQQTFGDYCCGEGKG